MRAASKRQHRALLLVIKRLIHQVELRLAIFLQVVSIQRRPREAAQLALHRLTVHPLVNIDFPGVVSLHQPLLLRHPEQVHVPRFVPAQIHANGIQRQPVFAEHHQVSEVVIADAESVPIAAIDAFGGHLVVRPG